MQATLIRELSGFTGHAALYRLDPPITEVDWDGDETGKEFEYVVVSAANVMFSGPETYIFPSDESGEVVGWGELEGSYRGGLSHSTALAGAGYSLVSTEAAR
jgi:hypothetical protein